MQQVYDGAETQFSHSIHPNSEVVGQDCLSAVLICVGRLVCSLVTLISSYRTLTLGHTIWTRRVDVSALVELP